MQLDAETIGLLAGLITTLLGLIPGIWALVRQYRRDVKDAERGSAEAVQAIAEANTTVINLYKDWSEKQQEIINQLSAKVDRQEIQVRGLTKAVDNLEGILEKERGESNGLKKQVSDLIDGIEVLIKQIGELGHKPAWRPNKTNID
jgi:chromosome segregation ATPase